ncbi:MULTISPECIES: Fic family protein [Pseudomonas]|uniref:Fic family protein n=1 Tax=Pseudomonas TaxID=286 RepID=UPI002108E456|nr:MULTISPECIES: Fic family protein [Pseudomonas]WSO25703.1 Fic family protein [Pseudomonas fluorescens]
MTADQWLIPPLPDSIPPSILAKADVLVTKTAFLAGLLAPETAACLSRQLKVSDAEYSRIIDGHNTDLAVLEDANNLASTQSTLAEITELRRRLIAALAHHYHLVQTQPLSDGNGAVARLIVHIHFAQIGLHPQLWSLSRGIARRQEEYHAALGITGDMQERQLAGGFQRTDKASLAFIEFMLDVCHEEVDYMTAALNRRKLRESVTHAFHTNPRLTEAGIRAEIAPAFLAMLIQGTLPRSEFVTFTGLQPDIANAQLNRLIDVGVVVSSSSDLLTLGVALPDWFVRELLPDLHKSW